MPSVPPAASLRPLLLALLLTLALHAYLLFGLQAPTPRPTVASTPLRIHLSAPSPAQSAPSPPLPEPPPAPRPEAPTPLTKPNPVARPAQPARAHPTPAPTPTVPSAAPALPSAGALLRASREFVRELPREELPQPTIGPRERIILPDERDYLYAAYLAAWQSKVERVGNLHYPHDPQGHPLSGELVVDVVVEADGQVSAFRLMHPASSAALETGARRIIELAGPFPPFPETMRAEVDRLHILRRWQFNNAQLR